MSVASQFPLGNMSQFQPCSDYIRHERDYFASLELARKLQAQADEEVQLQACRMQHHDRYLAHRIASGAMIQKSTRSTAGSQDESDKEMRMVEKAWKFVERVLSVTKSLSLALLLDGTADTFDLHSSDSSMKVSPIAKDDIFDHALAMMKLQAEFADETGKPKRVDLGFHYTRAANLARISCDGLLTKAQRDASGIRTNFNGSAYGDGIYTSDDPVKNGLSGRYGDRGILVARLGGYSKNLRETPPLQTAMKAPSLPVTEEFDSTRSGSMLVLKRSEQCLVLVQFSRQLLLAKAAGASKGGDEVVRMYQDAVGCIVDEFFNDGESSSPPPSWSLTSVATKNSRSHLRNSAPSVEPQIPERVVPPLAQVVASSIDGTVWRAVTQQPQAARPVVKSIKVVPARAASPEAVTIRYVAPEKKPIQGGTMPSGSMKISFVRGAYCSQETYDRLDDMAEGSIFIDYHIYSGIQKAYHPCPGEAHGSATHRAYLPDNQRGRDLLKRIKYAFESGLTFFLQDAAAASPSGGINRSAVMRPTVTWTSIPHKTSLNGGGPHGYPDTCYFFNCSFVLDCLGVPQAEALS